MEALDKSRVVDRSISARRSGWPSPTEGGRKKGRGTEGRGGEGKEERERLRVAGAGTNCCLLLFVPPHALER